MMRAPATSTCTKSGRSHSRNRDTQPYTSMRVSEYTHIQHTRIEDANPVGRIEHTRSTN